MQKLRGAAADRLLTLGIPFPGCAARPSTAGSSGFFISLHRTWMAHSSLGYTMSLCLGTISEDMRSSETERRTKMLVPS